MIQNKIKKIYVRPELTIDAMECDDLLIGSTEGTISSGGDKGGGSHGFVTRAKGASFQGLDSVDVSTYCQEMDVNNNVYSYE